MACNECTDGDGGCIYPWYGLRPHSHDLSKTGSFIGSTVVDKDEVLPENWRPDPDDPEFMGTYTHCLKCGAPYK